MLGPSQQAAQATGMGLHSGERLGKRCKSGSQKRNRQQVGSEAPHGELLEHIRMRAGLQHGIQDFL